jgi:hypothetical protein
MSTTATRAANLQTGRLTVRQAAQLMNVSERSVYTARRILRSGGAELIESIESGEMSLNTAAKALDRGKNSQPDRLAALCQAWERASDDERARFLAKVGWAP